MHLRHTGDKSMKHGRRKILASVKKVKDCERGRERFKRPSTYRVSRLHKSDREEREQIFVLLMTLNNPQDDRKMEEIYHT